MEKVQTPLKTKTWDYWYDNVKAFLIICVVVGHFASGGSGAGFGTGEDWLLNLKKFIYVFHMPVFMIVSGRFAKTRINTDDWPKVLSKVMVPYITCQVMMLLVCCIAKDSILSKEFSFLNPLYGMWYMMNVAVYTMLTAKLKDKKWLFAASLAAALLVSFGLSILYGGFHRLVCYYPFFLFGYYTSNMKFDFCKKPWFRVLATVVFFAIAVYIFIRGKYVNYSLLSMNKTYWFIARATNTTAFRVFINAIGRYIVAFMFFFIILGIMPTKKTFFSYIGKYSLYVYVLHLYIVIILRNIDTKYGILAYLDENWKVIAFLLASVALAFVLATKPVRKLTGMVLEPNFDLSRCVKTLAGTLNKTNED